MCLTRYVCLSVSKHKVQSGCIKSSLEQIISNLKPQKKCLLPLSGQLDHQILLCVIIGIFGSFVNLQPELMMMMSEEAASSFSSSSPSSLIATTINGHQPEEKKQGPEDGKKTQEEPGEKILHSLLHGLRYKHNHNPIN